ncbi:MAG: PRC-barrel domain-containing protein [Anaerolineales bacterium]|nr:PRC-barrel domain-containing protein [Anaerolineales bacterium]
MKGRAIILLFAIMIVISACSHYTAANVLLQPGSDARIVQLVGYQVYCPNGEWVGEVSSLLSDSEKGEIVYIVLSYKEPLIYGRALMVIDPQRYLPIPWERFSLRRNERALNLDVDAVKLIPAPYFDKEPVLLDDTQEQTINDFWLSLNVKDNN